MASGPYCGDNYMSQASRVWGQIWELQQALELTDGDVLFLFDTLPPCNWRAPALLKAMMDLQNVRAMLAESNSTEE